MAVLRPFAWVSVLVWGRYFSPLSGLFFVSFPPSSSPPPGPARVFFSLDRPVLCACRTGQAQRHLAHTKNLTEDKGGGGLYVMFRVKLSSASLAPKEKNEKKKKQKKTWGVGKTNVRVKGPEGAIHAPSPPNMVPGFLVTLCQTQRTEKYIPKGRVQTAAHDGAPRALTWARGGRDDPGVCLVR